MRQGAISDLLGPHAMIDGGLRKRTVTESPLENILRNRLLAVLVAFVFAFAFLGTTTLLAPAATADTHTNYCTYSLTTKKAACFQTEGELTAYRSTLTEMDIVSIYNWIQYIQGGGYVIFTGDHACTRTYGDVDYAVGDLRGIFYYPAFTISLNNSISSVSTYVSTPNYCDIRFYDGLSFTLDSSVFIDRCTHLGTCTAENWYDRASSFVLS
jgi:hypothetical protein